MSRRGVFKAVLGGLSTYGLTGRRPAVAAPELAVPSTLRARRQIATSNVKAPTLGQWHTLRVVAVDDRTQAWLDGQLCLEHRDTRLKSGRIGLWTKADSVTAFDDLAVRGVKRKDSP